MVATHVGHLAARDVRCAARCMTTRRPASLDETGPSAPAMVTTVASALGSSIVEARHALARTLPRGARPRSHRTASRVRGTSVRASSTARSACATGRRSRRVAIDVRGAEAHGDARYERRTAGLGAGVDATSTPRPIATTPGATPRRPPCMTSNTRLQTAAECMLARQTTRSTPVASIEQLAAAAFVRRQLPTARHDSPRVDGVVTPATSIPDAVDRAVRAARRWR